MLDRVIQPITLRAANAFVKQHHSYLPQARGCIFCAAAFNQQQLVAVIIIGRPISRHQDDGVTAEIIRLCCGPDAPWGTPSALIKRMRRACKAIGFKRIISYCDSTKLATAFKASNFKRGAIHKHKAWHGRQLQPRLIGQDEIIRYELAI